MLTKKILRAQPQNYLHLENTPKIRQIIAANVSLFFPIG